MSASPSSNTPALPTNAPTDFQCACKEEYRSACGDPFSNDFCVIHYPRAGKEAAFRHALKDRLAGVGDDLNLRGAYFPETLDFRGETFDKTLDCSGAVFKDGAHFSEVFFKRSVDFTGAVFGGRADFRYCKFQEETLFASAKFKGEMDFSGSRFGPQARAVFSEIECREKATLNDVIFNGPVDFSSSTFNVEGDFRGAEFWNVANFSRVTFCGVANFVRASFGTIPDFYFAPTAFSRTAFKGEADFSSVAFHGKVTFDRCTFKQTFKLVLSTFDKGVDFTEAVFLDYVTFIGTAEQPAFAQSASLDLRQVKVEKPQRVSFQTPYLLPHWFVDVDVREFDFPDVDWWRNDIKREISNLRRRKVLLPHRKLAIACRQLAVNAEENGRYPDASEFRFWAMNARRYKHLRVVRAVGKMLNYLRRSLTHNWDWGLRGRTVLRAKRFGVLLRKRLSLKGLSFRQLYKGYDFLYWLYWAVSGYGEKVRRAFAVLLMIFVVFAAAYTQAGFARVNQPPAGTAPATAHERVESLKPADAAIYSFAVMTLQRPEPKPATAGAEALVVIETILGPLQAALLALAIRRKFMR
jgi:uncharacterized protein YjbI with pentapeptide repeats